MLFPIVSTSTSSRARRALLTALATVAVASTACRSNSATTQNTADVYTIVTNGMRCGQGGPNASTETQMVCAFSVGDGLQFSIVAVGAPDAGIVFDKVLPDSPYRAAMSTRHGCVIVEPRADKNATSVSQYAFVSPRSGKVYHTWQECAAAT